jgi:AcrR family transcriptional regulator
MAESARRTQAERRDQSERSLLAATIEVIAGAGVGAVTFETLGRASGFSRGLATQRFGSKQKLIEAVLTQLHQRQEEMLREHRLDERPGLEAVLTYLEVCLRSMEVHNESIAYIRLLSSAVADANELRGAFREVHAQVEARLMGWIAKGKAEGAIRADIDERAAALMIGCLMFGASMQLQVDPAADLGPTREIALLMVRTTLAAPAPAA